MIVNFLSKAIEMLGHLAETAGSCEEALQKISEIDFDLVLLDVNLSDGDGVEFITKIRKISADSNIVVMTGDSSREMELRAREKGIMYYLIKPFEMKELKSIINHLFIRKFKLCSQHE